MRQPTGSLGFFYILHEITGPEYVLHRLPCPPPPSTLTPFHLLLIMRTDTCTSMARQTMPHVLLPVQLS